MSWRQFGLSCSLAIPPSRDRVLILPCMALPSQRHILVSLPRELVSLFLAQGFSECFALGLVQNAPG